MKPRRGLRTGLLALSLVTSMVVTTPAANADSHLGPVSSAIATAGNSLAQASMLADLVPAIPGFGSSPALILGLHEAFGDLANLAGESDLETALNNLGSAQGDGFTYAFLSDGLSGTVTTVCTPLCLMASIMAPPCSLASTGAIRLVSAAMTSSMS